MKEKIVAFDENGRARSFLIIGTEKAIQLDSGIGMTDFKTEIPKYTDLPVILVNTHGDMDHVGHNEMFGERYVHEADLEKLRHARRGQIEDYNFIKDGDTFDIGGTVLEVVHMGGHSKGSIGLYDRENRIMFGGDVLTSENTFMFNPSIDKLEVKESFEKLMALDLDIDEWYSCHNETIIRNYKELLADSYKALCDYLEGKPETDILEMHLGPNVMKVKRYRYGCATILVERVEE